MVHISKIKIEFKYRAFITPFFSYSFGKQERQVSLAANSLPFIKVAAQINNLVKVEILIDTGATISLLPISKVLITSLNPSPVKLVAANGKIIQVFGELTCVIGIKTLRRNYPWTFVVADVTNPIIGIDFLHHYEFVIDCKNGTLSDPKTGNLTAGILLSKNGIFAINQTFETSESCIKNIFMKYPYLTVSRPNNAPIDIPPDVHHRIDTGSSPSCTFKFRRLSPEKTRICQEKLNSLLEAGIIRPSSSSWATPLHFVKKKQPGEWRMVGDYRALNAKTIPDKYPLPHMNDIATRLHGSKIFSKIDLCQAYYNIPVNEEDKLKTAITTPFDASNHAVGAVLHQIVDDKPSPIGFFSKKISQAQLKYSTFDRELLGAYLSVLHFKYLIEGQNVTIFTDHKPLESAFKSQKLAKSDRQQRYLSLITEFVQDIQYIRGKDNIVADYLSRPIASVEQIPVSIDLPRISNAQTIALSEEEEFMGWN
uniref:Uncharacterized protein n=1 Tax=Lepeophtheirus salmonis TaxID=72036 RepID=A0A0K2TCL3_LEPSM